MRVRIYKPSPSATQSGHRPMPWVIEPEVETPRLPEPLMGWSSAEDTFSGLKNRMHFPAIEDAIAFAQKNHWEMNVAFPGTHRIRPRTYLDNFRVVLPQDEERSAASTTWKG